MRNPKLACCNFIPEVNELKEFAHRHGFAGIDWSFNQENLPQSPSEETALVKTISTLRPLEVRYHCAFKKIDLGDLDEGNSKEAISIFQRICRLVSKLDGRFLTIHVGLGRETTLDLSWNRTIERLVDLVHHGNKMGVRLCLENLAWGWTSRPELFEKLIRKSGCWATIDLGHALVSPSILTQQYRVKDFVLPHAEKILNGHIYHEEKDDYHLPPEKLEDLQDRLRMLLELPWCDWWVLELKEEQPLLKTLEIVQGFLWRECASVPRNLTGSTIEI
jgi:sugar phosphate isomerase/epimerase